MSPDPGTLPRPAGLPAVGRRAFVGTGVALTGAAAVGLSSSPAEAAAYTPEPSTTDDLPTAQELHTLRRWTYGYTPASLAALRAAGSPQAWFAAQLDPSTVAESPDAALESWWFSLTATSDQIVQRNLDGTEPAWVAVMNYARYAVLKRAHSTRSVLELMAEFWEDHFYIPRDDDGVFPFRIDFGHQMKALALTSFEQLLQTSTVHPAMGCSLDNAQSRKSAVNENLGRELLELHTVGVGNYTEDDVKNSARILTGYRVDMWSTWKVYYDPTWHWVGPIQVMGFSDANASADGQASTQAYLTYLAHHPDTARHVCLKLAQRFVSDSPSAALVQHLADVFLTHDTQIVPVLQALFASDEFWASAGLKVKTPTDELSSMLRSVGPAFAAPASDDSAANSFIWWCSDLGAYPWSHPRPDGPPRTNAAWVNPSRFLGSWAVHWTAGGGWWPTIDATWPAAVDRLPAPTVSLAVLVDHLSRTMLGEASTPALLQACCTSTGCAPSTTITASHAIVKWQMPYLIALVLNQPTFYLR